MNNILIKLKIKIKIAKIKTKLFVLSISRLIIPNSKILIRLD